MLGDLHRADMESKYRTVHAPNVSGLVACYPHFSARQLSELCHIHSIEAPALKHALVETLMRHDCRSDCTGYHSVLLFGYRKKDREGFVIPRTIESVREIEKIRRTFS
jgi:hypothetical protein